MADPEGRHTPSYNHRMSTQSYSNHPHRPVMTVAAAALTLVALAGAVLSWRGTGAAGWTRGMFDAGVIGALLVLVSISRVYITRLQDRIIRLEMRVRAAALLTPDQQRLLGGLDVKRVAALRFAADDELPLLVERTSRESLRPDEIKRAIRSWVPDLERT
jgi:hypothetical protein